MKIRKCLGDRVRGTEELVVLVILPCPSVKAVCARLCDDIDNSPQCPAKLGGIGMSDHCHLLDVRGNWGNDLTAGDRFVIVYSVEVVGVAAVSCALNGWEAG